MTLTKADVQRLKVLTTCPVKARKEFLKKIPNSTIKCISECCLNTLKGNIPLSSSQKKKLSHHKSLIRALSLKKLPLYEKRKLIVQKGGFLNVLIPAALSILTSLINR